MVGLVTLLPSMSRRSARREWFTVRTLPLRDLSRAVFLHDTPALRVQEESEKAHTLYSGYPDPLTSPMKKLHTERMVQNHMKTNGELKWKVIRKLGVLLEKDNGYTKEVNVMSWNDADPKLDIREWTPDHKPLRGVTLTENETIILRDMLTYYFDEQEEPA